MKPFNSPMDLFKRLPMTNCRECNEKTCMAFAVSVFQGKKALDACPYVPQKVIRDYTAKSTSRPTLAEDMNTTLKSLQDKVAAIDLPAAAQRVHGLFSNNKLTIKIFGKDFSVDTNGTIYTDIHVNSWVSIPLFDYIINAKGTLPSGRWVTFRDLKGGMVKFGLFQQRCEKPLRKIADNYPELFKDMLDIFDGKTVNDTMGADISIVLYPLPLVPLKVSYWNAEEGMESELKLFFDERSQDNLHLDSIYTLCGGIINMFEKISLRHG